MTKIKITTQTHLSVWHGYFFNYIFDVNGTDSKGNFRIASHAMKRIYKVLPTDFFKIKQETLYIAPHLCKVIIYTKIRGVRRVRKL